MNRFFQNIAAVLLLGVAMGSWPGAGTAADRANETVHDPLNATYRIAGQPVALVNGHSERPAAPGSAMKNRTVVWRQPVQGDLDGDGDEDAVLVLIHAPGGSGTFYYVAAAINEGGGDLETNTVWLGDRIIPTDIVMGNRAVTVEYVDRRPNEPFSTTPSIKRNMTLVLQDGQLAATPSTADPLKVTQGWVTIGHEVRSFRPCNSEKDLWLIAPSTALKAIMAAYRRAMPDPRDYRPVFMELTGEQVAPPPHGFGADYDGAFLATRLVRVASGASCGPASAFE